MKSSILKRLETLEALADRAATRPLMLIDVLTFDPADRDAYWSGDDAILTRYGAREGAETSLESVDTLIVSVHPNSRADWLETIGLDDDGLEAFEQRRIHEEARREREAKEAQERAALETVKEAKVRYDYSGYPINDGRVF